MTLSDVVDTSYRIHAKDLQGLALERRVINISYQGIENMAPVLHLEGIAKRLVLDRAQSAQMMALTRSPIPEDWVGSHICLHATDSTTIVIDPVHGSPRRLRRQLFPFGARWPVRVFRLFAVLAALAFLIWIAFQIGLTL